jgi:hypothetical protein
MRRTVLSALLLGALYTAAAAAEMSRIAGGSFESVLPPAPGVKKASVSSYRLIARR